MLGVFLSHNSEDKSFVRKLASDLSRHNLKVWLDEAEIKVGDSLVDKISLGISNMQFLAVVLSKNSVKSEWVKREMNIALNLEIDSRKLKVLPILIEDCEMPNFLIDKKFSDFRNKEQYSESLNYLVSSIKRDNENAHELESEEYIENFEFELPIYNSIITPETARMLTPDNDKSQWVRFIDQQLNTELNSISIGIEVDQTLKEHSARLDEELKNIGHKILPSIGSALSDLGRFQSLGNDGINLGVPRLSLWTPITCLGAIGILEDIRIRRNFPIYLDFRFPDALELLDYLEVEHPDGFLVGIGPTLKDSFRQLLEEYEAICIMPPIQQDFVSIARRNKRSKIVYDEIKTRVHDRYTSLELNVDILTHKSSVSFNRVDSINPTKALEDLANGDNSSLYGLWGLWAKMARESIKGVSPACESYFSDVVLMINKELLSRSPGLRQIIKESIGESWINLKNDKVSRKATVGSLIENKTFKLQFSRFIIDPFREAKLT